MFEFYLEVWLYTENNIHICFNVFFLLPYFLIWMWILAVCDYGPAPESHCVQGRYLADWCQSYWWCIYKALIRNWPIWVLGPPCSEGIQNTHFHLPRTPAWLQGYNMVCVRLGESSTSPAIEDEPVGRKECKINDTRVSKRQQDDVVQW